MKDRINQFVKIGNGLLLRIQRPNVESFLAALQAQETLVDKFEPSLWYGLLDFVTVFAKNDVRFTFKNGFEITV